MKIVYDASRNSEIVFICCLQLFFRLKDKSTHTKEGINAHAGVILIQRKKNVSLDVLVLFSNTFRIWLSFYLPRRMSFKLCAQILWFFFFIISWIDTTNEWRNEEWNEFTYEMNVHVRNTCNFIPPSFATENRIFAFSSFSFSLLSMYWLKLSPGTHQTNSFLLHSLWTYHTCSIYWT